jgi:hypothetical protein
MNLTGLNHYIDLSLNRAIEIVASAIEAQNACDTNR